MATPVSAEAVSDRSEPSPSSALPSNRESAVPPIAQRHSTPPTLAARAEAHVQAALTASTRTEAGLGALLRSLQHLSAGLAGASHSNGELVMELEHLRELLAASNQDQLTLKHRVALLEQALARSEQEAHRERKFLLEEQDQFIGALWGDHEREVAELRQKLESSSASERDTARDILGRLQSQRDEAQTQLARLTAERDRAQQELSRHLESSKPEANPGLSPVGLPAVAEPALVDPAPTNLESASSATEGASAGGESEFVDAPKGTTLVSPVEAPLLSRPPSASGTRSGDLPAARADFDSIPPDELTAPRSSAPSSKPPLRSKPDASTRPLIGYSLGSDQVEAEVFEGARSSSRPPRQ